MLRIVQLGKYVKLNRAEVPFQPDWHHENLNVEYKNVINSIIAKQQHTETKQWLLYGLLSMTRLTLDYKIKTVLACESWFNWLSV